MCVSVYICKYSQQQHLQGTFSGLQNEGRPLRLGSQENRCGALYISSLFAK